MNSWKVILATVVIFVAGVVTGGFLDRHSQMARPHRAQHSSNQRAAQPISPSFTRLEFLRRAQRELDLTPEQRERVDKLIGDSQERIRKLWEPITPKIHDDLRQTKAEFRALLTPQQLNRFDELLKQQQHFREQRRPQSNENNQLPVVPTSEAVPKSP